MSSLSSPPQEVQVGEENGACGGGCNIVAKLVVGYALSRKKVDSFITPSLLNLAEQRGIHLLPIDLAKPLLSQGPFHCILHKLSSPDWNRQLMEYSSQNPNVPIIDPPHAIRRLHDRLSMLRVVSDLQIIPSSSCSLGIPNQICVQHTTTRDLIDDPNLHVEFPVIAKPLVSDGTAKSHQMYLVFNREGFNKLQMEPPFVLQQFVNHGGVVFKVYVVGEHVSCVKRNSLPDYVNPDDDENNHLSLLPFSQISNLTAAQEEEVVEAGSPPMPPWSFLSELAKELRNALQLNLFNFDVIRESGSSNHYYIIDINYFPGYAKMPSYETVFTDFLLRILRRHKPSSPTH